jgi:UMF1 family MFS transporter
MNVVTLYFAVWLIQDLGASTTAYALAASLSSLLVAVSMPVFGAVSDAHRVRKPWVVGFTLGTCAATLLLSLLGHRLSGPLLVPSLLAVSVAANYCFQGALPFYNAMLPELVPPSAHGRLSGYGTALGYVGSIAGVVLVAPFVTGAVPVAGPLPDGVVDAIRKVPLTGEGGRAAAFVPTALLFLLFAVPFFLFTRDHLRVPRAERRPVPVRAALRGVRDALRASRGHRGALRFLAASWFYQDVIGTLIGFMAIYAVRVMGFAEGEEATLFVVLTVPAVAGSALAGIVSDRLGPKRTLLGVLALWFFFLSCVIASRTRGAFWAAGAGVGLVFGGIWATERPLLLTLVPGTEAGRYFGLLVLSARAAAIAGPLLWALIVDHLFAAYGPGVSHRVALGALAVLLLVAIALLLGVPDRWRERRQGAE